MIFITSESGAVVKVFSSPSDDGLIGFNPTLGFVSEKTFRQRQANRHRHGFKRSIGGFDFQFMVKKGNSGWSVEPRAECTVTQEGDDLWQVVSPRGRFWLRPTNNAADSALPSSSLSQPEDNRTVLLSSILTLLLVVFVFTVIPKTTVQEISPPVLEPVIVKMKPEIQKSVAVTAGLQNLPKEVSKEKQFRRAIQQDLGFLGLLGRKDLRKAIGGVPTELKDASPGAGPGGKEGSGGELLVGLGQGVKRVTVGNSGVAGLGGIGTKGAGGGQGGYGTTMIGSGEGRGLLSQGIALEGGLDRAVIQATIAKYISQVRACYEEGLKHNDRLKGLVTMNFEIAGTGNLNFAKVGKSTLGDKEVEQCISDRMMGWQFPHPRGGVTVKVTYPFMLKSAGS